jgi:hypothetical protein
VKHDPENAGTLESTGTEPNAAMPAPSVNESTPDDDTSNGESRAMADGAASQNGADGDLEGSINGMLPSDESTPGEASDTPDAMTQEPAGTSPRVTVACSRGAPP